MADRDREKKLEARADAFSRLKRLKNFVKMFWLTKKCLVIYEWSLRVLDLSLCTNVASENLLYLFFHDPYVTLHKYAFLPNYRVDQENNDRIVQIDKYSR